MGKMNYKIILPILISVFLITSIVVLAKPNIDRVPATNKKSGVVVIIPEHAVEIADGVFSLGTAINVDGRVVEGLMLIDYKEENARPPWAEAGGKGKGESKCFEFLARGAKWKALESWVVNTVNNEGLTSNFIFDNVGANIQKWETASSINILGDGSITTATLVADTISPDGSNEVYFGDINSEGAIAVTIVWGIFSGPPRMRELVEWDQVYDQVDYDWSSSGEVNKMDFENIATHELGHSVGMGHPPDECTEETMYRFADFGETKKRDLNIGDVTGINELY